MNVRVKILWFVLVCIFPLEILAQNVSVDEYCNKIITDPIFDPLIKNCVEHQIIASNITDDEIDGILEKISKTKYGINNKERIENIKKSRDVYSLANLMRHSGICNEKFVFVPKKCYYHDSNYHLVDNIDRLIRIPEFAVSMQDSSGRRAQKTYDALMKTDFGPFFNEFVKDKETQMSLIHYPLRCESWSDAFDFPDVIEKDEKALREEWQFLNAEYFLDWIDIGIGYSIFSEWYIDKDDKNVVVYTCAVNTYWEIDDPTFYWASFSEYVFKKVNGRWMLYEYVETSN